MTKTTCVRVATINRLTMQMLKDLHWRHKTHGLDQQQPKGTTRGKRNRNGKHKEQVGSGPGPTRTQGALSLAAANPRLLYIRNPVTIAFVQRRSNSLMQVTANGTSRSSVLRPVCF